MGLYESQKGVDRRYTTYIAVQDVRQAGDKYYIKGLDNNVYSHWAKPENEGWENKIKVGAELSVFVIEKTVNGKLYRNIYKNHFTKA